MVAKNTRSSLDQVAKGYIYPSLYGADPIWWVVMKYHVIFGSIYLSTGICTSYRVD